MHALPVRAGACGLTALSAELSAAQLNKKLKLDKAGLMVGVAAGSRGFMHTVSELGEEGGEERATPSHHTDEPGKSY